MKTPAILLAALALSACTTTRYYPVPCLTPDQLEERRQAKPEKIADNLTGRADEDIKPITGKLIRMEAWGDGNLLILEGCTGDQ